mmetsp:Transcript_98061/g.227401  ORF Transcript_98061/g.227401 Transcript_98061/m.227401 type:complete len:201 (+) Transcript_98061:1147-1749(+)
MSDHIVHDVAHNLRIRPWHGGDIPHELDVVLVSLIQQPFVSGCRRKTLAQQLRFELGQHLCQLALLHGADELSRTSLYDLAHTVCRAHNALVKTLDPDHGNTGHGDEALEVDPAAVGSRRPVRGAKVASLDNDRSLGLLLWMAGCWHHQIVPAIQQNITRTDVVRAPVGDPLHLPAVVHTAEHNPFEVLWLHSDQATRRR